MLNRRYMSQCGSIEYCRGWNDAVEEANETRAEAIKEFAERLKNEMGCWEFDFNFPSEQETAINLIDHLVKEMVGDE